MEQLVSYYSKCDEYKYNHKEMNSESNLRGKHNDVFTCDSSVDDVLHFEMIINNKGFSDYIYNEINLQLMIAITQVKSVVYRFINDNQQVQRYNVMNKENELYYDNSDFAYVNISIDINMPSRSNVTLVVDVVCDRNAFYKQYQNKEHTLDAFNYMNAINNIDEPILTIHNNNNQILTTIPLFNSDNNKYNTFKWKFNSPSLTFYYSNITEYSWYIDTMASSHTSLFTLTSLVLCGSVLLFILLLLYIIYIIFKDNKTHRNILHEEQVTISANTKDNVSDITTNQEVNQNIQMYMELPNIALNKDQEQDHEQVIS
jgi:hypothetical protein